MSTSPESGRLILVSGPPGAGKSTLARKLARGLRAVHLDKDCIDEPFSPNDRGERYTHEVEPKVLTALLALAKLNRDNGLHVLLDVPWTHILLDSPEWVRRLRDVANPDPVLVLEAFISDEELRRRLEQRGLQRDKIKLTDEGWMQFKARDRLGARNPMDHHAIDMTRTPDDCFADAQSWLRSVGVD